MVGSSRAVRDLPSATVARLPLYIRALSELELIGVATVQSEDLAHRVGVSSAVLRRDLSYLGSYGTRGVGYQVTEALRAVQEQLGLTTATNVVIVGLGHLGQALANYPGFSDRSMQVVGLFDVDPELVGSKAGDPVRGLIEVRDIADLSDFVTTHDVRIAVLATPAGAAQDVADRLVAAGVTSILNFAPVHLELPAEVHVRQVDLAAEMQILALHAAGGHA